jgi:hypothetical protein
MPAKGSRRISPLSRVIRLAIFRSAPSQKRKSSQASGIGNQTDAAIVLLLDQLVTAHFGRGALCALEAMTLLGLDAETARADDRLRYVALTRARDAARLV